MQRERQYLAQVIERNDPLAAEIGQCLGKGQDRQQRAHREAVARLCAEVTQAILSGFTGGQGAPVGGGQLGHVLGLVLELIGRGLQELELADEELEPAAHGNGQRHGADLAAQLVDLAFGESDRGRHERLGLVVLLDAVDQVLQEARVERQRAHDHVDAVAQGLDHLVGAAAGIVIGRQIPGRLG